MIFKTLKSLGGKLDDLAYRNAQTLGSVKAIYETLEQIETKIKGIGKELPKLEQAHFERGRLREILDQDNIIASEAGLKTRELGKERAYFLAFASSVIDGMEDNEITPLEIEEFTEELRKFSKGLNASVKKALDVKLESSTLDKNANSKGLMIRVRESYKKLDHVTPGKLMPLWVVPAFDFKLVHYEDANWRQDFESLFEFRRYEGYYVVKGTVIILPSKNPLERLKKFLKGKRNKELELACTWDMETDEPILFHYKKMCIAWLATSKGVESLSKIGFTGHWGLL